MRELLYILAGAVAIFTACNKEMPGPSVHEGDDCVSLRLSVAPMEAFRTKADAIGDPSEDDIIDRLDIFVYSSKDTLLFDRKVYTDASGVDLSAVDVK